MTPAPPPGRNPLWAKGLERSDTLSQSHHIIPTTTHHVAGDVSAIADIAIFQHSQFKRVAKINDTPAVAVTAIFNALYLIEHNNSLNINPIDVGN